MQLVFLPCAENHAYAPQIGIDPGRLHGPPGRMVDQEKEDRQEHGRDSTLVRGIRLGGLDWRAEIVER